MSVNALEKHRAGGVCVLDSFGMERICKDTRKMFTREGAWTKSGILSVVKPKPPFSHLRFGLPGHWHGVRSAVGIFRVSMFYGRFWVKSPILGLYSLTSQPGRSTDFTEAP